MNCRYFISGIFSFILGLVLLCTVKGAYALDTKVEDIVADYSRSVVFVAVEGGDEKKIGSGFVVDKEGLILTNYHIISGAQKVYVKFKNNKAYEASVMVSDARHDIAVLQVRCEGLKPVKLSSSRHLDPGERVVTIGHPLGLENTVSDGLVSAVRRLDDGTTLVQITVPLSPGSSGGPLFDMHGKVVGITTSSFDGGQNLNFAVPIYYAKTLIRGIHERMGSVRAASDRLAKAPSITIAHKLALEEQQGYPTYTVKSKDTLYSLSRKFNVTVEALTKVNDLSGAHIRTGQVLRVPVAP